MFFLPLSLAAQPPLATKQNEEKTQEEEEGERKDGETPNFSGLPVWRRKF